MLTITDLFAGFGGASTGCVSVPGVELKIAANHWDLAIEVHNLNHPDADHAHVDLHAEDPRFFPKTDILWASPECTQWSQANGKKADLSPILDGWSLFDDLDDDLKLDEDAATRSRLLMFDVLRFAEHHRYLYMVVENVVDIATSKKYAEAWRAWRAGLKNLGYRFRVVSLNSMHAQAHGMPAPQSRDRLYVVCWLNGLPEPDIDKVMRPRAFCPACGRVVESRQAWKNGRTVGKYRSQYVYVCATSGCGRRVEPGWLPAAAAIDWTLPGKRIGDRVKPLADKTRRRIAAGIDRYWNRSVMVEAAGNTYDAADPNHPAFGRADGYYRARPADDVLTTLHTTASKALVVPVEGRDGKQAKPVEDPLRTMTCRAETALACMPFIAELRGGGSDARAVADALSTITAGGNHHGLVVPVGTYMEGTVDTASEVLRTQTTGDYNALLTPFILERRHEYRTRSVDQPLSTLTANDTTKALLTPYYGASETAKPTDDPIGTLTTHDRYALVMRNNGSKGDGAEMTTPIDEVLRTLTTAGHQSLLMRNNSEKGGNPARHTTPAGEYMRTLTANGPVPSLLTPGDLQAAEAMVDDCLFRMLEPSEVGAGMAFPTNYIVRGSRRNQVKGYGNAVTPPAARDLIAAVAEAFHQIEVTAA